MSDTLSEAFAMKAAKPSVVPDGGDVEDPEGDTDAGTVLGPTRRAGSAGICFV